MWRRAAGARAAGPARAGRRHGRGHLPPRISRPHLHADRRPRRRDGVSRPAPAGELLQRGIPAAPATPVPRRASATARMNEDFRNQPLLELRRPEVREELLGAMAALDRELPLRPTTIVGGKESHGDGERSTDPCDPAREVATLGWAGIDAAERALELALNSRWPLRQPEERIAY